jgi:hypothetical protein
VKVELDRSARVGFLLTRRCRRVFARRRQLASRRRKFDMVSQLQLEGANVTDQERQKAEEMISRLEIAVGQIFPRDGGNAGLITTMIQTMNGLRSLLGIVRPHEPWRIADCRSELDRLRIANL